MSTTEQKALAVLIQHASGQIHHSNRGACPDELEGPDMRDLECPVCQAIDAASRLSAENEALRAQECALIKALAECRDAFPMPDPGAELESTWGQAMGDPESVPGYVKAQVDALRAQLPDFQGLPKRKLDELLAEGYRITGFAIERDSDSAEPRRGFINAGGLVGWWWPNTDAELHNLRAQVEALTKERDESRAAVSQSMLALSDGIRSQIAMLRNEQPPLTRPAVPEPPYPSDVLHNELVRFAGILRDCGRIVDKSGDVEGKLRRAAVLLAAAPQPETTIKESSRVEAQPTEAAQKGGV